VSTNVGVIKLVSLFPVLEGFLAPSHPFRKLCKSFGRSFALDLTLLGNCGSCNNLGLLPVQGSFLELELIFQFLLRSLIKVMSLCELQGKDRRIVRRGHNYAGFPALTYINIDVKSVGISCCCWVLFYLLALLLKLRDYLINS